MHSRISRETMLMRIAHIAAQRGTCGRLSVGAVIAREARPISLGYVGAPANEPHCSEAKCDLSKPCTRTRHAERNAIDFANQWNIDTVGADLFCTHSPCIECARLIVGAGIKRVYYQFPYRLEEGVNYMEAVGLSVFELHDEA